MSASPSSVWVFLGELASYSPQSVKVSIEGSEVEGIPAIDTKKNGTGFSGVYAYLGANGGSVKIKAQLTKGEGADKNLTKTFNLNTIPIEEAYASAVKERAKYLGLNIDIPQIKTITYQEIYDYLCDKHGKEWLTRKAVQPFLDKLKQENNVSQKGPI